MDPGARVSDALLAAQRLEQIHDPGTGGVSAGRQGSPVHAGRISDLRREGDLEEGGKVFAWFTVRAGDLPGGDEIGCGLELLEDRFDRLSCRRIACDSESFLQRRGRRAGLLAGKASGNLDSRLDGFCLDRGVLEQRFDQFKGLQVRNLSQTSEEESLLLGADWRLDDAFERLDALRV